MNCIPAFAAIRKRHENDEVVILTERSLVGFCKQSRFFDKVWLDVKPQWFQPSGIKDIMRRLKAGRFDMVYDLQNDKRSAWYFRLMGYHKPRWNSAAIDWCSHYYNPGDEELHFQDHILNQLKITGIKAAPLIDISYMANDEANQLPERFAMICSGGDRDKLAHKWNPTKYAEVIDHLHERHSITSVLVGDGGDDVLINALVAQQCVKAKPINFSGKTSINGIISVAKKALFCIGNETATTHIAAFSGCNTIMMCSRFSPSELLAPRVKNLVVIEEPTLENVEVERAIMAIEDFALVEQHPDEFKAFRATGDGSLQKPDILTKAEEAE